MTNYFILGGNNPYKAVIIYQLRQTFKLERQFIYVFLFPMCADL